MRTWFIDRILSNSVERHDDVTWSNNLSRIQGVRSNVLSQYTLYTTNLKLLVLIGHVAVPYTGMFPEDGHTGTNDNHYGAWSSDMFYADINGNWTDGVAYGNSPIAPRFPITTNFVGDGKFDQNLVPSPTGGTNFNVELGVGRIDFANLPYLSTSPGNLSELALLRRYFNKNHRYRHGQTPVLNRGRILNFIEPPVYSSKWQETAGFGRFPNRTLGSLFPPVPGRLVESDILAETNRLGFLWSHQLGFGDVDRIRAAHPTAEYLASNFAYPERQPRTMIGMFMGSWFGDWNLSANNFLRSFLGVPDYGLAAMWARDHWPMTEFPLGRSLGELQQFANDYLIVQEGKQPEDAAPKRWFCILGDPALRYPPMSPVRRFAGTRLGGNISLNWDPTSATTKRYFVFRSSTTTLGPYSLLSDTNGLTSTFFLDSGVPGTPVHYQLRSSELAASGSGTFWNPSQSITVTVP